MPLLWLERSWQLQVVRSLTSNGVVTRPSLLVGSFRHGSLSNTHHFPTACSTVGSLLPSASRKQRLFSSRQDGFETNNNSDDDDNNNNAIITEDMTGWSVKDVLPTSLSFLEEHNAPEPESSVTQLLACALQLPWHNGFVLLRNILQQQQQQQKSNTTNNELCSDENDSDQDEHDNNDLLSQRTLTFDEARCLQSMLVRRVEKEPLQYILGKWDFLDHTFSIRPPLLCPRPETEELVCHVINDVKQKVHQQRQQQNHDQWRTIQILDIGAGTGVIGISLAATFTNTANVTAIDINPIAIECSNDNAAAILTKEQRGAADARYCNNYRAIQCSAKEFGTTSSTAVIPPFDIVVSNPPYIPSNDMRSLSDDVLLYESTTALFGGTDGMDVIRDIIRGAPIWGHRRRRWQDDDGGGTGCPTTIIWLEVDPSQPSLIQAWLNEAQDCGVVFDSTHQDMYGRDRFVKLKVV